LKHVEIESFAKSFTLFFLSIGSLVATLFYLNHQKDLQNLDKVLLAKMHLCSYSLDCKEFKIDFTPKNKEAYYTLFKNRDELWSLYPLKDVPDFSLKLSLSSYNYNQERTALKKASIADLLWTLLVVLLFSISFSFYSLYPLRQALLLTREFVKDILHDFNTPISTMRLNLSLLSKELGENKKLERIERSIENILLLQENLRNYLQYKGQNSEEIALENLIQERVRMLEKSYPKLKYSIEIEASISIHSSYKGLLRIVDNLLSNASKYNKEYGEVKIIYNKKKNILSIADTGLGIKKPKDAFNRFYKEHERGMGIGLHIVKKLSHELGIKVDLESKVDKGTTLFLTFKKSSVTINL